MVVYGSSIGNPPNTNNKKKFDTKAQNPNLAKGLKVELFTLEVCTNGNTNKINKLPPIATTPPNLLGMALKMA